MKPEPPPYPRLVPDIDCDENIILPGTTVYAGHNDDGDGVVEELAKQRAAKRRRIEAHAQAYLRGDGLFILSASLKGPFDESWRNPWSDARRKRKRGTEATSKVTKKASTATGPKNTGNWPKQIEEPATITPNRFSTPSDNPFNRPLVPSDPPKSNEKVENWLRRNSALPQQNNFTAPLSPTPKAKSSPILFARSRNWTPTKQLISVNSQDVRAPVYQQNTRVEQSYETIVSTAKHPARPEDAHSRLQNALRSELARHAATSPILPKSLPNVTIPARHDDRAEAEIARMKRTPTPVNDPKNKDHCRSSLYGEVVQPAIVASTNKLNVNKLVTPPVSDQEQGDRPARQLRNTQERFTPTKFAPLDVRQHVYKPICSGERTEATNQERAPAPVITPPEVKLKRLEDLPNEDVRRGDDFANVSQQLEVDPGDQEIDICRPPVLSTTVTDETFTNLPPSAQQKPELQTMPSAASSSIKLLEPMPTTTNESASMNPNASKEHNCGVAEEAGATSLLKQPGEKDPANEIAIQGYDSDSHQENAKRVERVSSNPGLLQALEAGEEGPNNLNLEQETTPKGPLPASMLPPTIMSPRSVKKQKPAKKSKKASFAAEPFSLPSPSNGSIKSALK
ncbi:hypothetical protein H2198_010410, partial [Neophaeococcomyces mojaviensis]